MPKGGINNLMKQFNKVQEQMARVQEELAGLTVEGSAGGGMVKVIANGKQEIQSVKIDPEILKDDVEMVEDMIVAAVNQALTRSQELSQEKMAGLTGGMLSNLPGGLKIPGL
ncbi:MAG: YbaB/EbfC family nucleoid-associated protein [Candidatus Marinimicrobia bacterium]|nr:YbaB/EbfC family nucleoid-associated protein [Candidatus Neomarinimicrobiota bacterium]MDD5539340.1 YbaB/EbfC family nucleoid-associated protein [Candidatus Neomarinimicrobiota bacterium]